MKCPNCGSENIIWDYIKGCSVCTSCGLVIDQLYEEFLWYAKAEDEHRYYNYMSVREALYEKRKRVYAQSMRKKMHMISLYERYAKRARKNVTVDLESLRRGTGRIYRHVKEPELESLLDRDEELRRILENIIERDPVLSSRTFRGKVALALMIKAIMHGSHPNIEDISSITGVSRTHARRLWSTLKKRLSIAVLPS